ncbi:beta-glucosidase family protein [Actinomadura hibisca]|uniref:beta-glucosidase family protein n=1 Tax=Actinomadura hibisca TaxID=68565 RepID=UPI000A4465C4|nr:glycoside hydrolase family 3 C-terminal domain-containing protein [Actinomadura hibisca]
MLEPSTPQDSDVPTDAQARALVEKMTLEEKVGLMHVPMASFPDRPSEAIGSAAFHPGIGRLGIPAIQESDASLGVANPNGIRPDDTSTALPSSLSMGASFDVESARRCGMVVGAESCAMGFAMQLAGGSNLIREPRGGRNFEYISEDPLHTGLLAGSAIAGLQSQGVVSTIKHFAVNAQETGRVMVSSDISERPLRESDLLAFQLAIEHGRPGAVMTGYNRVNGEYASQNAFLLSQVLKGQWRYPGVVVSDWGGTHSTVKAVLAGLDRQSGEQLDEEVYFGDALLAAVREGTVPLERIDDAVIRLLRALLTSRAFDPAARPGPVDRDAHAAVVRRAAADGIVLLANDGVLPLAKGTKRIVVVGGHADVGVLSGGGSTQVMPAGSTKTEGSAIAQMELPRVYHPSAPLDALRAALPDAAIDFHDGDDQEAAVAAARDADVAVVIAEQWSTEGRDQRDLSLPDGQDDLIAAIAAAAPRTVVVLETGGPVLMPWSRDVAAVVAAWYPGSEGGPAIADVLTGAVCPGGRLPVTFPQDTDQLPRPVLHDPAGTASNPGEPRHGYFSEDYDIEGADIGYRWYERQGHTPLFPFGFGLSYTTFDHRDLEVSQDGQGRVRVEVTVTNTGPVTGTDTPQVYVTLPVAADARCSRLAGWARVRLDAGESRRVTIELEPRLLAVYDVLAPGWRTYPGDYRVDLRSDARTTLLSGNITLDGGLRGP